MPKSEQDLATEQALEQLDSAAAAINHARLALTMGRYHEAAQKLSATKPGSAKYEASGAEEICQSLAEQKRTQELRDKIRIVT